MLPGRVSAGFRRAHRATASARHPLTGHARTGGTAYPPPGPGNPRRAPNTWIKPNTGYPQKPKPAFVHDDNFNSGKLNINWQWNHVEDDSKWSLTEKKGVLRLHSLPAPNFYAARNSLCQKR